jgi:hypothetical protein
VPRLLVLLVVVALSAGACGSGDGGAALPDDPGSTGTGGADAGSSTGAAGEPGSGSGHAAAAALPADARSHLVTDATTTFDVTYAPDTTVADGDALVEADDAAHRYTLAADALDRVPAEGDVLIIAGRALGHVTSVSRDGGDVTVTLGPASLADAIDDGTVGWDVPLTFAPDALVEAAGATPRPAPGPHVRLAGLSMVGTDGVTRAVPADLILAQDGAVDWTYPEGDRTYRFRLTPRGEQVDIKVQVTKGGDGDPSLVYTAEGTIGSLRSVARGEFADGELTSLSVQNRQLAGDLDLSVAAAGSGLGSIDFELPGVMLEYVVLVGPVPLTIGISTKVIGNISVPNEASATAKASFSYRGDAGFSYDGSEVDVDATMGTMQLDPEPADAAGMIGSDVDVQFGVAFPRVSVSLFDQLLVPYVHTGMILGSSLTWGPVCKRGYVKLVVEAGYDFKVLGATLSSDKTTLAERERTAAGDNCPQ